MQFSAILTLTKEFHDDNTYRFLHQVHLVVDAIGSRSEVDRSFAIERMKNIGAHVATTESVILNTIADSSHPRFKEVQGIIKDLSNINANGVLQAQEKAFQSSL